MKYLDEYRNQALIQRLAEQIKKRATRCWHVMEICGGQTHTLIRSGIDQLLDGIVQPVHGPGCPVCVTPLEKIDRAINVALTPRVTLATYGDMMRVPGSNSDLLHARSRGADVRIVYSPLDALMLAEKHADREIVFFAVGFETTAPANAMSVWLASQKDIPNFSLLVSHVLVPPAIEALLQDEESHIDGFIAPGHVCTVMGFEEYEELARRFSRPFVVAGFEPADLLEALLLLVAMLEENRFTVENQYTRCATRMGNLHARKMIREVFEVTDMKWRGLGTIHRSGFRLKDEYQSFDAEVRFPLDHISTPEPPHCCAGQVLQGKTKPSQCPAFGKECTPERPLGAPMVSSEGACAAYYSFRRFQENCL
ncbi:MAG: hydrogenase formation protein HypD [Acidobacteria bacterium]|nr:hydrogenase formation protein HypD [Acidobacteriota bacterium]